MIATDLSDPRLISLLAHCAEAGETVPTDGGRLLHRLTVAKHEAVLCEVVP